MYANFRGALTCRQMCAMRTRYWRMEGWRMRTSSCSCTTISQTTCWIRGRGLSLITRKAKMCMQGFQRYTTSQFTLLLKFWTICVHFYYKEFIRPGLVVHDGRTSNWCIGFEPTNFESWSTRFLHRNYNRKSFF